MPAFDFLLGPVMSQQRNKRVRYAYCPAAGA
jgi:hypothetical protein